MGSEDEPAGIIFYPDVLPENAVIEFEAEMKESTGGSQIDVIISDVSIQFSKHGIRRVRLTEGIGYDPKQVESFVPCKFSPTIGEWFKFRMERRGSGISYFINDEKQELPPFSYKCRIDVLKNRLGFYHWKNKVGFRNIQIHPLPMP